MSVKELVPQSPIAMAPAQQTFSLAPRNIAEAMELAKIMANSDMVPKDFKGKPGNVLVAVQMGAELGLAPMQALQNIAVVNGRPSVWGDALLALCSAHPSCVDIHEDVTDTMATCTAHRRGRDPITRTFSVDDAKKAGLWGKGVWQNYPKRMLQMRARAWALRDAFADVLRGLQVAEEVRDYSVRDVTPSSVSTVAPAEKKAPATSRIAEKLKQQSEDAPSILERIYACNSRDELTHLYRSLTTDEREANLSAFEEVGARFPESSDADS